MITRVIPSASRCFSWSKVFVPHETTERLIRARLVTSIHTTRNLFQPRFLRYSSTSAMPNEVDRVIHPHPTGAAASLAQKHVQPASTGLTLYGGWFCPFVQRIWVALLELNLPHQYIEINPYHKEPHFLALNPRGLVPTLAITTDSASTPSSTQTNGVETDHGIARADTSQSPQKQQVLYESVVVADYLNDRALQLHQSNNNNTTSTSSSSTLYPTDLYLKAYCHLWIDHIGTRIVPAFYRLLQHTPDKTYSLDSARHELRQHVYTFAKEIGVQGSGTGPWFLGEKLSMVDVMLSPWACRLFLLDHYKGFSGLPKVADLDQNNNNGSHGEEWEKKEAWERWWRWYDAILKRESVVSTMSDKNRYVDVYQRYAEDTTGSLAGKATREGRGLP